MTVLALDLGTTTGWVLSSRSGAMSGASTFSAKGHRGARYQSFEAFLDQCRASAASAYGERIATVVYELVRRHNGVQAAHVYGGFEAILLTWCARQAIPAHTVEVAEAKRAVTGKGNAGKDRVFAAVQARVSAVRDHNEADAWAINWAFARRSPEAQTPVKRGRRD